MAKRTFNQYNEDVQDGRHHVGDDDFAKRQKKKDNAAARDKIPKSINSARQIHGLFAEYSNPVTVQEGIQVFKRFLAECRDLQYALHIQEEPQLAILQEYLESQLSRDGDETCADIMQAWSFASQSNNIQLLSSVPTVIHLLLRTISLFQSWKKHGIALAKTVLQQTYLKTIYRSLGGNKDAISSPCLRLLTEINKFDNGSLCGLLHQSVDFTVKDISRNLEVKKQNEKAEPVVEDPDRPSVRTVYIRFILSFFQYAPSNIKADVMGFRNFTTPLFKYIRMDTALIIGEVVSTFQKHILTDKDIPRVAKTSYFNDWSLSRLAELCYREDKLDPEKPGSTVGKVVYEFLSNVCTDIGNGVCFKDNGWYSGGGREAKQSPDNRKGDGKINNRILLGLLKSLRPYSNMYHHQLLIGIFRTSPELVAAYYNDNTAFNFDPKLTATWVGLASVILDTLQLEVPAAFGSMSTSPSNPPPIKSIMDNLFPQLLTKSVLTKCLTYNNYLVKFLSLRIFNAIFKKLADVLDMLATLSSELVDTSAWDNTRLDVLEEVSKTVPEMSIIISAFNQVPEDGVLQKEAASRLLTSYYQFLPETALAHKFDFASGLARALGRKHDSIGGFANLELQNSLDLARVLPDIKWWNKAQALNHSPAITLMKLHSGRGSEDESSLDVYDIIEQITQAACLFQTDSMVPPLEALMDSLTFASGMDGYDRILQYLDNACSRFVQSPYKYFDAVGLLVDFVAPQNRSISPLLVVLFHQFKFVDTTAHVQADTDLASWLHKFLENCLSIGDASGFSLESISFRKPKDTAPDNTEDLVAVQEGFDKWRTLRPIVSTDIDVFHQDIFGYMQSIKLGEAADGYQRLKQLRHIFDTSPAILTDQRHLATMLHLSVIRNLCSEILHRGDVNRYSDMSVVFKMLLAGFESILAQVLSSNTYEADFRKAACRGILLQENFWFSYFLNDHKINPEIIYPFYSTIARCLKLVDLDDDFLLRLAKKLPLILYQKDTQSPSVNSKDEVSTFLRCMTIEVLRSSDIKEILKIKGANSQSFPHEWSILALEKLSEEKETLDYHDFSRLAINTNQPLHQLYKSLWSHCSETSVKADVLYEMLESNPTRGIRGFLKAILAEQPLDRCKPVLDWCASTANTWISETDGHYNLTVLLTVLYKLTVGDEFSPSLSWQQEIDDELKRSVIDEYLRMIPDNQTIDKITTTYLRSELFEYIRCGVHLNILPPATREYVLEYLAGMKESAYIANPDILDLLQALYEGKQDNEPQTQIKAITRKMVYALTAEIASGNSKETSKEFCRKLGLFFRHSKLSLSYNITSEMADSLMEALCERLDTPENISMAAYIVLSIRSVSALSCGKLLQMILNSDKVSLRSRMYGWEPQKDDYLLIFVIYRLFESSNRYKSLTTLDGLLALYRGSNDAIDTALLQMIVSIEAHIQQSVATRFSEIIFTDDVNIPLITRGQDGKYNLGINSKVLLKSSNNFFPTKVTLDRAELREIEDLDIFLSHTEKIADKKERSMTYDVGFIMSIVMYGMATADLKIDIKDVVEKGALAYGILGLSSEVGEERGMAEAFLISILGKLEVSTYRERTEIIHLLCAVLSSLSSSKTALPEGPVPTVITVFLANAVGILANPGHFLYEKVMRLLQSQPSVYLRDIPLLSSLLHSESENYGKEVLWMLSILASGIKTGKDLEVYRVRGVFESIMGLYFGCGSDATQSSSTGRSGSGGISNISNTEGKIKEKIVEILWNAGGVEGGGTTLITRTGVLAWIKICITRDGLQEKERVRLKRLAARLYEGSAKVHVKTWSEGNIGRVLENLVLMGTEKRDEVEVSV